MLVAKTRLGHRKDAEIAALLAEADAHRVVLSDTERRRSRVRTETTDGTDIGIVVADDLGNGDVLETDGGDLVVVELDAVNALVLEFDGADVSALEGVELGHALGNRHWDLALRDGNALFPVPDTRERMLEAVADHLPAGVETRFEAVPPTAFDDGGHGGHGDHDHEHDHGSGHDHDHGHTHTDEVHSHSHGDPPGGVRSVDGGHDG